MIKKMIALAIAALLLDASAYAGVDVKDCSATISVTNTWQKLANADPQRNQLTLQNLSASNSMGFYPATFANGTSTPTPTGIGSPGVFTLTAGWSYTAEGAPVWSGAIWIIGTSGDVITCKVSPTQP